MELRQTLECSAAYFAAERATVQDKATMSRRLLELQEAVARKQPIAEAKADLELHLAIADAAHNAPLSLMLRNIYSLLLSDVEENLTLIHRHDISADRLHAQHAEMVERITAGDAEGAKRVVFDHLELIRESYIENGLVDAQSSR